MQTITVAGPTRNERGHRVDLFTLSYEMKLGTTEIRCKWHGTAEYIEEMGRGLELRTRDDVWNIAVLDAQGADATEDFGCFL